MQPLAGGASCAKRRLRVLHVIHGYPMRYNAGSEVYTQGLCRALAERHETHVFTRQEDPFLPEYAMAEEADPDDARVTLHIVNMARARDRYRHAEVDRCFAAVLEELRPHIVHIGHLNHLSTSLVFEARQRDIPVVFTLHDFWLMCPRGQFIQTHPADPADIWAACDGQEDRKCAVRCYAKYHSGAADEFEEDARYWTQWVRRRMAHVRRVCAAIDVFIAPSEHLLRRFRDQFHLPARKLVQIDYGFHPERLAGRCRPPGEPFTFGYIGTHTPAKGVDHLIAAFGQLAGDTVLRIWGRPRGLETESLTRMARALPGTVPARVQWMGEYQNQHIVREVFNRCDAIVVPSIWDENSPLVIHEALQARMPVVTANRGGMAEYVRHEHNGLLFAHRDADALAEQMQRLVDDPAFARRLGRRGYAQSPDGDVPDMAAHSIAIEGIYAQALAANASRAETTGAPA